MTHKGLWEQLEKFDCIETAKRAKCRFIDNPKRYVVTMLNSDYSVNLSDRNIFLLGNDSPEKPASFLEQLCILAYLINAQDLPPANKLVGARILPGGQFFFRGLHRLPTKKLENAFGSLPENVYRILDRFDAQKRKFGDASIQLYVLPRLPLTIVIWRQCEEFGARASILFDQTAASQLPLDALLTAVNLTVEALIKAATQSK
jgi:hypothetical protein